MRASVLAAVKSGEEVEMNKVVEGLDEGALPYIYLIAFRIWAVQGGELDGHPHQVLGEILKTRMKLLGVAVPEIKKETPPPPPPEEPKLIRVAKPGVKAGNVDFNGMEGKGRRKFKTSLRSILRGCGSATRLTSAQKAKRKELDVIINSLNIDSLIKVAELVTMQWTTDGFLNDQESKLMRELMKSRLHEMTEVLTEAELAKREVAEREAAALADTTVEDLCGRLQDGSVMETLRLVDDKLVVEDESNSRNGSRVADIILVKRRSDDGSVVNKFAIKHRSAAGFVCALADQTYDSPEDAFEALKVSLEAKNLKEKAAAKAKEAAAKAARGTYGRR